MIRILGGTVYGSLALEGNSEVSEAMPDILVSKKEY